MTKSWSGRTFGNGLMHRWLIGLLKHVDVRLPYAFAAALVVPVCMVVNASGRIDYRFFRQRMRYSRLRSLWACYVSHCLFAQVVIDRFAAYAGQRFSMTIEGHEHFLNRLGLRDSFIVLSAHVGNYELAGYSLDARQKPFRALVFGGEKDSVMNNRNKLFANNHVSMIPVGSDMSHLFAINQALLDGDIVSMPADRVWGSSKTLLLPFMGGEARFPQGPFSVATMRGVDVLSVNVLKTSAKGYRIFITPLTYDRSLPRQEQEQQLARSYANELESIVRRYPTQWYNYYEFWEK